MKLTTKLLLGATMVAGLSISAFAACATDVDMGAKKLTNVANGTSDGDAVNVAQVFKTTVEDLVSTDANITGEMKITRAGKSRCLEVDSLRNSTGSALPSSRTIYQLQIEDRPLARALSTASTQANTTVLWGINVDGTVTLYAGGMFGDFPNNERLWGSVCWLVN